MFKITKEIFSAILILLFGVLIYFDSTPTIYGFVISNDAGILPIFIGIFWIGYVLLNAKKIVHESTKVNEQGKFAICPKCKETYYCKEVKEGKCTKCNSMLEDLDGFYDRHPELK